MWPVLARYKKENPKNRGAGLACDDHWRIDKALSPENGIFRR